MKMTVRFVRYVNYTFINVSHEHLNDSSFFRWMYWMRVKNCLQIIYTPMIAEVLLRVFMAKVKSGRHYTINLIKRCI